jgi:hypothetical protein
VPATGYRRFFTIAARAVLTILLHLPVPNLIVCLPVLRFAAPQWSRFVLALTVRQC